MIDLEALPGIFGDTRIAWVHLTGFSCVGLSVACPIDLVVCLDHGREQQEIAARIGVTFLSLEGAGGSRGVTHDDDVEKLPIELKSQLEAADGARSSESMVLACPYPCEELEGLEIASVSPPWGLCHWLNDKRVFLETLGELGLPILDGRWLRLDRSSHRDLANELGHRFVAQARRGSGGSGTRMISDQADLRTAAAQFASQEVWLTRYAGDLSLNINALALPGGTVSSWPNVQLEGLEDLGASPGAYCGNDYTATSELPGELVEAVFEQTEVVGRWLASLGFVGLFGLDFVVDERGRPFAVDLNPRWQGSTNLLTQAEVAAGRVPLAALDLALRLGAVSAAEVLAHRDACREPVRGSQMILRAPAGRSRVLGDVDSGIYDPEGDTRLGPGVALWDCSAAGDVLATGGVPEPGTGVEPSAYLLRLLTDAAAIDPAGGRLMGRARRVAASFYHRLRLRPA